MTPTVLALLVWTATTDGKYTAASADTAPPDELAAAVREVLAKSCVTVADPAGTPVTEVWFRAELPSRANAAQVKNGLTYHELPETTVLAAVRFPRAFTDYRKQDIPAGVYTLRLAFQPETGDHAGTAPHAEFGLLTPAADDSSPEPIEVKDLVKRSLKATGGDHPGVMLLFPHRGTADGPGLTKRADGVWTLDVRRPVVADGGNTALGLAVTVAGQSKTR